MRTLPFAVTALATFLFASAAVAQPAGYCISGEPDPFAALRPVLSTDPGAALAAALANDGDHTVSGTDAERIVKAAIAAIGVSADPAKTHENNKRIIGGALALSRSNPPRVALEKYESLADEAVASRLDEISGSAPAGELPAGAARALREVFDGSTVTITEVTGGSGDFYTVKFRVGSTARTAYISRIGSTWLPSPVKLSARDLEVVKTTLRDRYIDSYLNDDPDSDEAQIERWGNQIHPERVMWPGVGDSDPIGFTESYPVVFESGDPSGADYGWYVGYNPANGDIEVESFN